MTEDIPEEAIPSTAVVTRPTNLTVSKVLIAAGVGVGLGAFLPWIKASAGFISITKSGIDGGDGWFFLAGGVLISYLGYKMYSKGSRHLLFILIVNALLTAMATYELIDVVRRIGKVNRSEFGSASIGYGLWMIAASCIAIWICLFKLKKTSTEHSEMPAV